MASGKPNTAAAFMNRMLAKCESPAICALEDDLLENKDAAKAKAYVCKRIVSAAKFLAHDKKVVEQVQACMKEVEAACDEATEAMTGAGDDVEKIMKCSRAFDYKL